MFLIYMCYNKYKIKYYVLLLKKNLNSNSIYKKKTTFHRNHYHYSYSKLFNKYIYNKV